MNNIPIGNAGKFAYDVLRVRLKCHVMQSEQGFYIGTFDDSGPISRESVETYSTFDDANTALVNNTYTQNWHL